MKKKLLSVFLTAISVTGSCEISKAGIKPLEWSDIGYTQGRYSRIYFDYIQIGGSEYGTFYVINDWMVNRDDGGINGGLNEGEYNKFTFKLGNNDYLIKIFGNGKSSITYSGPDSYGLLNFNSATNWTTSPNDPDVAHTLWEFSFDVKPTTITTFSGCDPVGPVTTYVAPDAPSVITGLPSIYPHIIDGAFSDVELPNTAAPDPMRDYFDPVVDPDIPIISAIELKEGGGAIPSPEPSTIILLGAGLGLLYYRTTKQKTHNI